MLKTFLRARQQYPRQYWLMFWGLLLSTSGASMIWPFLLIYVSGKLDLPLAAIASLTTINALVELGFAFVAGPIVDRLGRKWVMVFSLFADAIIFLFMIRADTYAAFAILMALRGISNPLYRVGADAMLADLIPAEKRLDAYALIRMVQNMGIAIGPAVGGFLASASYNLAFFAAAAGLSTYATLLMFFARETLAKKSSESVLEATRERLGGYDKVFRDKPFIATIGSMAFGWVTAVLMWIILPVYANTNFGVPENQYGWIPTTNALMVVILQMLVTRFTRRYRTRSMMALGMTLYAIANGLVALMAGFWGFWMCMVIMTFGELIIVPTSSTYTANTAPADMRGRYMSIYGLIWTVGRAIGPLMGGWLNDLIAPQAIWYGGLAIGLTSAFILFLLSLKKRTAALPAS